MRAIPGLAPYTATREAEYGGLFVVRDKNGNKIGTSQSEAAAKLIVRNARRRAEAAKLLADPKE